jgi:pimeloyl-ACP methyl ester carboxylesterase
LATFVLIHGAYHDGSAWDRVIERLEQRGHTAFAPTLAGHGKGAEKTVNHAQCTQSAIDYIVQRDLTDLVLVGHSCGGTVVCKTVEVIPERIRRLVFYAGLVMNDGESIYDSAPPEQQLAMLQLTAASPDGSVMLPFEYWRDAYIGDADLEVARWAYQQLSPQPIQTFMDRLDMKKFYSLHLPRSYVVGTEDCAMPPGEWQLHPRMSSRLGVHRLVQMPGGHELMFSNPKGLADKLVEAGRD